MEGNAQAGLARLGRQAHRQREHAAAATQRATDLTSQLQRQQRHHEREIAHLRDSLAATAAALRNLEASEDRCRADSVDIASSRRRQLGSAETVTQVALAHPRRPVRNWCSWAWANRLMVWTTR